MPVPALAHLGAKYLLALPDAGGCLGPRGTRTSTRRTPLRSGERTPSFRSLCDLREERPLVPKSESPPFAFGRSDRNLRGEKRSLVPKSDPPKPLGFIPGPDDDDAALFAAGAAVLRWDADCRSWFHAALANGRTHLAVDVRTAAKVADLLVQNDAAAQFLARGARGLFDAVLCPRCAAAHWARALVALGGRFGVGDARAARAALRGLGAALCGNQIFNPTSM